MIAGAASDVQFAYLFGSAATGRLSPESDVGVAIYVSERADAHAVRLDVARAAAKHLGSDAVDVVVLNAAPIALAGGFSPAGACCSTARRSCVTNTSPSPPVCFRTSASASTGSWPIGMRVVDRDLVLSPSAVTRSRAGAVP